MTTLSESLCYNPINLECSPYYKPQAQNGALLYPQNKNFIIRPYLGQRFEDLDEHQKSNHPPCGLRSGNFPLYLDQFSQLKLMQPQQLARTMALGLATGHWRMGIDMMDVKFVVGSRPRAEEVSVHALTVGQVLPLAKRGLPMIQASDNDKRPGSHYRIIQMWMLDFDKTHEFHVRWGERDRNQDIATLVKATLANDPYYPHCLPKRKEDWELWLDFRDCYVKASQVLIQRQYDGLVIDPAPGALDRALRAPKDVMNAWFREMVIRLGKPEYKKWITRAKAEKWRPSPK